MIVALEGIDASGKKLQAQRLKTKLLAMNKYVEVETFDFPHYEGVAGGLVSRVLRGETIIADNNQAVSALHGCTSSGLDLPRLHLEKLMASWSRDKALLIQCAMLVDRCEHVDLLNRFVNAPDRVLILDRYYLSGIVYGQVDGLERDWLEAIHSVLPQPDLFFILDISVEESVRRRPDRQDYYEKNLPKLRRASELYRREFELGGPIVIIDGTMTPEDVTAEIMGHLSLESVIVRGVEPFIEEIGRLDREETLVQLNEYRRQATRFAEALVEAGHGEVVDRIIESTD